MLDPHEMLRTQVTNLLNKANSFKDSYSCGKKKKFVVDFGGMVGIGSQMGLAPQTWQLKSAFAIESHSGRDGDIQSYLCPGWTIPGTSQASSCPRNLECIVWGKAGLLEGEPGGVGAGKSLNGDCQGAAAGRGGQYSQGNHELLLFQEHGNREVSSGQGGTPWDTGCFWWSCLTSYLTAFSACAGLGIRLASNLILDLRFHRDRDIESYNGLGWEGI